MDLLQILRAFLSEVYKMTDGEIDALLTAPEAKQETAIAGLLEKDRARVATLLTPRQGQTFQDGYKKAKAEVLTQLESELKTKYGLTSDLTGIELVQEAIDKANPGGGTLTEDQVRKHSIYLKLEKDTQTALAQKEQDFTEKFNKQQAEFNKAGTLTTVSKKALEILNGLNPILPTNATAADNQRKTWLNQFNEFEFEVKDDGNVIISKDGKVLDDGHGYNVKFENFVKERANNYFDFQANNGGSNSGNNNNNDGGEGKGKTYPAGVTKPKTLDELTKIVNDPKIKDEDKNTVMETWEKENPNA